MQVRRLSTDQFSLVTPMWIRIFTSLEAFLSILAIFLSFAGFVSNTGDFSQFYQFWLFRSFLCIFFLNFYNFSIWSFSEFRLFMYSNRIQLVESMPDGLYYPDSSPSFMSTFDSWNLLLNMSTKTVDIGSFYWTLRGADFYNHSTAWQGEKIFNNLLEAGTKGGLKIRIAQSKPSSASPNLDTEILAKRKAAEVRTLDFDRLIGSGVLHTKFWIADDEHFYIGSANMDWRSLTQVNS